MAIPRPNSPEELEVLIFGRDAVERRKFLEQGLAEIEAMRLALVEQGSTDIENHLATQRAMLDTKLADLRATQEQLAAQQKSTALPKAMKDLRQVRL